MAVSIDDLKLALNCETDTQLADELGIERSTVSQWRRRDRVPARWHFLLNLAPVEADTLAPRRRIFGDGDGYYLHMAAIAVLDESLFIWPELTPVGRGSQIEDWVLKAAGYVIEVLGERVCNSYEDYHRLVLELSLPAHREALRKRLFP